MLKISSTYIRFFGLGKIRLSRILKSLFDSNVMYFIKTDHYELVLEIRGTKKQRKNAKRLVIDHLRRYLIGFDKLTPVEQSVGSQLIKRHLTITGAESLTAGMFQSVLGNVPGISAVFPGGFVTYSNHAKHQLLGIPSRVINQNGVVSKPVAKWMAEQSRKIMKTDLSVSFTGAAGPTSLEGHPAGTVWIGLAVKNHAPKARLYHLGPLYKAFSGFQSRAEITQNARDGIRLLCVKTGLKMINDELHLKH